MDKSRCFEAGGNESGNYNIYTETVHPKNIKSILFT